MSDSSAEKSVPPHFLPPSNVAASPEEIQQLLKSTMAHGVPVTDEQAAQLAHYCCLVWDVNTRMNLTRHTNWDLFVTRDLIDSIELSKHVARDVSVMDVGSGGGVPGIVLAILRPDLKLALCESIGKKAAALQAVVKALRLPVVVHAERAEIVLRRRRYDVVTVRAVGAISKLLTWFGPVWKSIGRLLLIKGPRWTEEVTAAEEADLLNRLELQPIAEWATPGRDGLSVLLKITKSK